MIETLKYEHAIVRISNFMDHHKKLNAFDASLLLAYLFDGDKEAHLEYLMAWRERQL